MKNELRNDYPDEPIGGDNPYYCCSFCRVPSPQINGRLSGHAKSCEWRQQEDAKLQHKNDVTTAIEQLIAIIDVKIAGGFFCPSMYNDWRIMSKYLGQEDWELI